MLPPAPRGQAWGRRAERNEPAAEGQDCVIPLRRGLRASQTHRQKVDSGVPRLRGGGTVFKVTEPQSKMTDIRKETLRVTQFDATDSFRTGDQPHRSEAQTRRPHTTAPRGLRRLGRGPEGANEEHT